VPRQHYTDRHSHEDELISIPEGEPTLVTARGQNTAAAGECAQVSLLRAPSTTWMSRSPLDAAFMQVRERATGDDVT